MSNGTEIVKNTVDFIGQVLDNVEIDSTVQSSKIFRGSKITDSSNLRTQLSLTQDILSEPRPVSLNISGYKDVSVLGNSSDDKVMVEDSVEDKGGADKYKIQSLPEHTRNIKISAGVGVNEDISVEVGALVYAEYPKLLNNKIKNGEGSESGKENRDPNNGQAAKNFLEFNSQLKWLANERLTRDRVETFLKLNLTKSFNKYFDFDKQKDVNVCYTTRLKEITKNKNNRVDIQIGRLNLGLGNSKDPLKLKRDTLNDITASLHNKVNLTYNFKTKELFGQFLYNLLNKKKEKN